MLTTSREFFDNAEQRLRAALVGRTLLGEIVFEEADADLFSKKMRVLVEIQGPSATLRLLASRWPVSLSVWLVNEAFFHFESGTYWPNVLGKIGVEKINQYSSRFGQAFLSFLRHAGLPEFRQLKTRWSYLGPILAHCGIPRSCLPEFFEKVVPQAEEYGVGEGVGFEDLMARLRRLYLTRPTERFLLYGGSIAENFLQRAVEIHRTYREEKRIPDPDESGLPTRVMTAFRAWTSRSPSISRVGPGRRPVRRPDLFVDFFHGLRMFLPPQKAKEGESCLTWLLEADSEEPTRLVAQSQPGLNDTSSEEVFFTKPFAALKASLFSGESVLGRWSFPGVSSATPYLFFHPDSYRVLPTRSLESGPIGLIHLSGWRIMGKAGGSLESLRPISNPRSLPFDWNPLVASVYDLSSFEALVLEDASSEISLSIDLRESAGFKPRLVADGLKRETCPDGTEVFFAGAPALEIWKSPLRTFEEFLDAWTITVTPQPAGEAKLKPLSVSLGSLRTALCASSDAGWHRVALDHPLLLGPDPWGEFEIQVKGPIGRDGRFSVRLLPDITTARDLIDWEDLSRRIRCLIQVPPKSRLRGARAIDEETYETFTAGNSMRLYLETKGFGGREWSIPFDLRVPLPAWALYLSGTGRHLATWSRELVHLSLNEVEEREPLMLFKLETPMGTPASATLSIEGPSGTLFTHPLPVGTQGYGKLNLLPFLGVAHRERTGRLPLKLELFFEGEKARSIRIPCGSVMRDWCPEGFQASIMESAVRFSWREQVEISNRVLRVESLSMPWEEPRFMSIPDDNRAAYEAPFEELLPRPGLYSLTLGTMDPWTDRFEPARDASILIRRGRPEQWRGHPLFSDPGPEGTLYRMVCRGLAPRDDPPHEKSPPERNAGSQGDTRELAGKILVSRERLRRFEETRLLVEAFDGLLRRLSVEEIIGGVSQHPNALRPEAVLRAGLLTRKRRLRKGVDFPQDGTGGPAAATEALWRAWKPLGMWADMQLVQEFEEAESRILHHLGKEHLMALCPVKPGCLIHFQGEQGTSFCSALVLAVEGQEEHTPFEIARMDPGISLLLEGKHPESFDGRVVTLSREVDGHWHFDTDGEASLPKPAAQIMETPPAEVRWRVTEPKEDMPYCGPPEPPIVEFVRGGQADRLEQIRMSLTPVPKGAIGSQAYLDACFSWCSQAASDPNRVKSLAGLCETWCGRLFDDLRRKPDHSPGALRKRLFLELRKRWHPNTVAEPLYGVHFLSAAVALSIVWKAVGRGTPFVLSGAELDPLALEIYEFAPELLEHDLLLMGALEALYRAGRRNGR